MAELDALDLREGEGAQLLGIVAALVEAAAAAEERETIRLERRPGRRDPGCRPAAGDDPYNAFVRRCRVEGAAGRPAGRPDRRRQGQHLGRRRADDRAARASRPGPRRQDAVVVERILDAGGTIVGKLNMDELRRRRDRGDERDRAGRATRSIRRARPAARRAGPARRSGRARSTSRSASTRAGAAGSPPRSAASSASRRRTGSCRRTASVTSTTRSTT